MRIRRFNESTEVSDIQEVTDIIKNGILDETQYEINIDSEYLEPDGVRSKHAKMFGIAISAEDKPKLAPYLG